MALKTEAQIAELTEALEDERTTLAALREELESTKSALAKAEADGEEREQLERQLSIAQEERDALVLKAEAQAAELTEALEKERAALATHGDKLEAAESLQADAEAQIAELTEALEDERTALAALREELESTKLALAKTEADWPVSKLSISQEDAAQIGGQLTEKGILVNFDPDELWFESASAVLPTTNLPTLDRIAAWLEDRPEVNVRIEGHTDSLGRPEINQPLSQQRAEAVRQALIERGLAPERVVAQGAGATQPIADNATPEGQSQNRRVELYLMPGQED